MTNTEKELHNEHSDELTTEHTELTDELTGDLIEVETAQAFSEESLVAELEAAEAEFSTKENADDNTEEDSQDPAPEARLEYLSAAMEALLFMNDKPVTIAKLRTLVDTGIPVKHYRQAMETLRATYKAENRGLEIIELSSGFQIRTKPHLAGVLRNLIKTTPLKLTNAMMEALSVIAYKQPVTKDEVDQIRGVDCGYLLRVLMEKKLVRITGRSDLVGRPILYGTSHEFLELFTMRDVKDLPPLHEIEAMIAVSEVGDESVQNQRLEEFGQMVEGSLGTVLFDDSKLDDELEAIRGTIDSVSTTSEYIDYQKAVERHVAKTAQLRNDGKTEEEILELLGPTPEAPWLVTRAEEHEPHEPSEELRAAAQAAGEERRHETFSELLTEGLVADSADSASTPFEPDYELPNLDDPEDDSIF